MTQLQLIHPAQFGDLGFEVGLPLCIKADLPVGYKEDPITAIEVLINRDRGPLETAHQNVRKIVAEKIGAMILVALQHPNPKACLDRGLKGLGYPKGEAIQCIKAYIYEKHPELAPYMAGLYTPQQINGHADGNPELRKLLGSSHQQDELIDGRPTRKAAAAVDLNSVRERKATRQHSGEALEMQVEKLLQWAGLAYQRSAQAPMLKLFGERSEPDFTVTEGIDDPSGLFLTGFYVECKHRPSPRVPDSDLTYAMYSIARFYDRTTILVLETPGDAKDSDRIWSGVSAMYEHMRKTKTQGNLSAVLNLAQFRGLIHDQIGKSA